jgi:hypothetical protein
MRLRNILRIWLPFAIVTTAFSGLVYVSVQQSLRQSANDPQIQMAEDAARALQNGAGIESVIPAGQVDINHSLAPFLVVYDSAGKPQAASGRLDGGLPEIPTGVLEYARANGQNRVSWQPREDVRVAAVVFPYDGGFVLAGRSLREVEKRELQVQGFAGAVWALTLLASLAAIAFGEMALADRRS